MKSIQGEKKEMGEGCIKGGKEEGKKRGRQAGREAGKKEGKKERTLFCSVLCSGLVFLFSQTNLSISVL